MFDGRESDDDGEDTNSETSDAHEEHDLRELGDRNTRNADKLKCDSSTATPGGRGWDMLLEMFWWKMKERVMF